MPPYSASSNQSNSGASAGSANQSSVIDLILVDDHPTIRSALRQAIEGTIDMRVVAETGTSAEAFQLAEEHCPDVMVVDLSLEDGHGFDLLQNVRTHCPDTRSLVFSVYGERVYAERALRAGASGYLMKSAPPKEVIKAVRTVQEGEVYLSREMTLQVLGTMNNEDSTVAQFPIDEFTDRELQVFQMLGEGIPLPKIADRLNLARKTVETYRRRAKEKLGIESSEELVAYAAHWTLAQPTEKVPARNGQGSPDAESS